jgi:hypothetical protein
MNDPIVDEIRRIRDEHAAQFNYDLDAIFRDLKERERKSGRKFVNGIAYPEKPVQERQLPAAAPTLKPIPSDSPSHTP